MSALPNYPILSQVLQSTRTDPHGEPEFIRTKQVEWHKELEAVSDDHAALDTILAEHRIKPSEKFWSWLEAFTFCGGFGKQVREFARLLADRFVAGLESPQRQILLMALTKRSASYFFNAGGWVTGAVLARDFPIEFVANWIQARLLAYGEDLAVGEHWRMLQQLAEDHAEFAFALAQAPAVAAQEEGRKFQIELLGGLRFRSSVPTPVAEGIQTVLEQMRISSAGAERANYWRTMKRPLILGRLPDAELENALAATKASAEEYDVGFELAMCGAQDPTPKAQTLRLLNWLAGQFDQPRTPFQQYSAATVAGQALEHVTPEELGFDVADLLLKIQPIDEKFRGIWQKVEQALYPLSDISRERFHRILRLLARDHWPAMHKMLEYNAPLHGSMVRLGEQRDETAAYAAELIASKHAGERRFGFHLVEDLQLPGPKNAVGIFTREEFTTWIHEFRLNNVFKTVAQQLINASARIDIADEAMVSAFHEEVLFQCKNLPGLCLEQLKGTHAEHPLFAQPIEEADAYFSALKKLATSPIKAHSMPGLGRAIYRKKVRDDAKMDEAVKENTIFGKFIKESYLLYGTRWARFNGGVLTKPDPLHTSTFGMEMPRKPFIDPEGFLEMKLMAQVTLEQLKKARGIEL